MTTMLKKFCLLMSVLLLAHLAAFSQTATQTVKLADWCSAVLPTTVKLGETIRVAITLTGITAPTKVDAHLHYNKVGGVFGGMFGYAPPQDVKGDGTFTFTYKITPKEGLESVHLLVFLSPSGDWSATARQVTGPAIPLDAKTADGRDASTLLKQISAMEYRKSWLHISANSDKPLREGDAWPVTIDYYLDPSEDTGSTRISFIAMGPWVDCPDGVYTKSRAHNGSGGYFSEAALPGHHVIEKQLTIPKAQEYNSLLCIANFSNAEVGNWPWQIRVAGPMYYAKEKYYALTTDQPGNLFTYAEPVRVYAVMKDATAIGKTRPISWRVTDTNNVEVASGTTPCVVEKIDQRVPIDIAIKQRGVFLLQTDGDVWGKQQIYFARIPDVLAMTGGKDTPFGMTFSGTEPTPELADIVKSARKLGLTSCRLFCSLKAISPTQGDLRSAGLEQLITTFNANGINPWICLVELPPWLQQGKAIDQGYFPIPFNDAGWSEVVRTLSTRLKGKIYGWEWLNEIVPGDKCQDPAAEYLRLCKIGTETAKAVDPTMKTILAGGLWPRNFRTALLSTGIGQYIDVLPVHYSDGQGILEATEDVAVNGFNSVAVCDDETARGLSTWKVPPGERLKPDLQCNWVLNHWPDELVAGAKKIVYFGGADDPCGNWSYLMGDMNPRPVAVTIAVLSSKLSNATPLGKFFINDRGVFHLFVQNGKPILLATLAGESKTASDFYNEDHESLTIPLKVGVTKIIVTDYLGNEQTLPATNGVVALPLTHRTIFIEGADLESLQSYLIPSIARPAGQMPTPTATVTFLKNAASKLDLVMSNISADTVSGAVRITVPDQWPQQTALPFSIQSGKVATIPVPVALAKDVPDGLYALKLNITYDTEKLATVEQHVTANIISPAMLGNLIQNGGFETAGDIDTTAEGWKGQAKRVSADGLGLGLGQSVAKFTGANGWQSIAQTLDKIPPGRTYLYSSWIWSTDMQAGSNVYQHLRDGSTTNFYIPRVFDAGNNTGSWKMLSCHIDADPNMTSLSLAPVANGKGRALFDNVRLTVYEGSDYTAEAHKLTHPLTIDGNLDKWDKQCPIPLLGDNQLVKLNAAYQWTPANLSGVAYLAWDEKNLYVGIEVRDNIHYAKATGEQTIADDSVIIAFRPGGAATPADKAFCYYLSSALPGGSGKATLFRPVEKSGGLTAGQLARDSSRYEMVVKTDKDITTYEIRMPLSDMGGITPTLGNKIGLSIVLNDNDGAGRQALMKWGNGIYPAWSPAHFGILTLVE